MTRVEFGKKAFLVLLVLLGIWLVVLTAWVSDDAYITFRTVENTLAGYGLVFNIGERVQTYTHPLWMFALTAIYAVTSRIGTLNPWAQIYFVDIYLSIALSVLVLLAVAFLLARTDRMAVLGLGMLILSKSFIDYSTSGLENPLTHLLLVIFAYFYLRRESDRLWLLSLIASLAALNRLDTLAIYLPALAMLWYRSEDRKRALWQLVIGMLPLIAWELFSLFYYGWPYPNTAYAKLNTGISRADLFAQGWQYFLTSLRADPLTLVGIIGVLAFVWAFQCKERFVAWGAGILLYLLYVLSIGGDFMFGRFFAAPLLAAVLLLVQFDFSTRRVYLLACVAVLLLGILPARSPIKSTEAYGAGIDLAEKISENGVSDERWVYYPILGLMNSTREKPFPGSVHSAAKWQLKDKPIEVELVGPLGMAGYQAGPNVHMIDKNGLADPLMVRLPIEDPGHWRIGHFRHVIPDGYLETLVSGENQIEHQQLAEYYRRLTLVVRGDLWDVTRLQEILRFNLGLNEHLVQAYLATLSN